MVTFSFPPSRSNIGHKGNASLRQAGLLKGNYWATVFMGKRRLNRGPILFFFIIINTIRLLKFERNLPGSAGQTTVLLKHRASWR